MKLLQSVFVGLILGTALMFMMPSNAFPTIHQISVNDDFFSPLNSSIGLGDTVRWTNNGIGHHTTTSNTRIWSSGVLLTGQSFSRPFLTPGVFAYHCSIHVAFGMVDTIRVLTTAAGDPQSSIPDKYELAQNYPNPFNAQTAIQYDLPVDADVTLSIFDILGNRIETLVTENQTAGHHLVYWNASAFPSGIYFYQIQAGDFTLTRRATLLK
jgi:plastocyanin